MTEVGFRMVANICFNLLPITLIVTYFFAPCANREQSFQSLDFGKCRLEFGNKLLPLLAYVFPFRDVPRNGRCANNRTGAVSDGRYR